MLPAAGNGQPARPVQIGFLYPGVSTVSATRIAAVREGMRAVNYADADRAEFIVKASEGNPAKLPSFAAELVERKVDLIVPVSPSAVRAAKAATSTIPIVANDLESDPVAAKFVTSLARPGGNISGVFSDFPDFGTKWIELLKEAIPSLSHALVMHDPSTGQIQLEAVEAASRTLKVGIEVMAISSTGELEQAFATVAAREQRPDAVVLLSSPIFGTNPQLIAKLTFSHGLPIATLFPDIARAGGLMAYGPNLLGTFRQVGTMAGKVLQGMKVAELPVERPSIFELVINVKTAKALGLTIPNTLLLRADEVVE